MGRNLFKVPLGLLVAQAEDTRIHLVAMEPVRDAFVAAEQDLAGLERELAAAAAAGSAAGRAAALAREAVRLEGVAQRAICTAYASWCVRVRRRLDQAELSDDDERVSAARKVRALLGKHPGRRLAGTLEALRRVVPELAAQSTSLRSGRWKPDLVGEVELLLASAEASALRRSALDREYDQRGRDASDARTRLRRSLAALRAAWNVAIEAAPGLPSMPLGPLEAYAARGAALQRRQ